MSENSGMSGLGQTSSYPPGVSVAQPFSAHALTGVRLSGARNSPAWSTGIRRTLESWEMDSHLDDPPPTPTAPEYRHWRRHDARLISMLIDVMTDDVRDNCYDFSTVRDMWLFLERQYMAVETRTYDTMATFFEITQGDQEFDTFTTRYTTAARAFTRLLPYQTTRDAHLRLLDQLVAIRYLAALHPRLSAIRDSILSGPSLPTFEETQARVRRALLRTSLAETDASPDTLALGSRLTLSAPRGSRPRGRERVRRNVRCTRCHILGQTEEECYTKHPHLRPTTRPPSTSHVARTVPPPLPEEAQTAFADSLALSTQVQRDWLFDSGASDHMTGDKHLFTTLRPTTIPARAPMGHSPLRLGKVTFSCPPPLHSAVSSMFPHCG